MKKVTDFCWLVIAGCLIFGIWFILEKLSYGVVTISFRNILIFGFWIWTLTRAYKLGKGKTVFKKISSAIQKFRESHPFEGTIAAAGAHSLVGEAEEE